jgi:hypothetical protein
MADFPKLKTGAAVQYPFSTTLAYQNQTCTFVDGTQQRYRGCMSPITQWEIRLTELDEGELAAIEEFFLTNQGAFGTFSFTDPRDGQVYDNCSLEADGLQASTVAEMRNATTLTVAKNRK